MVLGHPPWFIVFISYSHVGKLVVFFSQSCTFEATKFLMLMIGSYAIGGLAGGEEKDAFWRVVAQCTAGLPEDKPRYVMVSENKSCCFQQPKFKHQVYQFLASSCVTYLYSSGAILVKCSNDSTQRPQLLELDIILFYCLMYQGVGYPLDIVVCSALGADMYDCVYPTRTGRFGTALVPEVCQPIQSAHFRI